MTLRRGLADDSGYLRPRTRLTFVIPTWRGMCYTGFARRSTGHYRIICYRYAGVEHAAQSVTSGYRLAFTYNLIFAAPDTPQSVSSGAKKKLELEKYLSTWKHALATAESGAPMILAYTTEHKYTDASLRFEHLKGRDRYRAQYLKSAVQTTIHVHDRYQALKALVGVYEAFLSKASDGEPSETRVTIIQISMSCFNLC